MRARTLAIMGLFASLLSLLGCDRAVVSQVVFGHTSDTWTLLQGALVEGPLGVEAIGELDGAAGPELAARIADTLRANFSDPWLKFEATPGAATSGWKLVYAFDVRSVRQPEWDALCAGRPPRLERDPTRIKLHVVLCAPHGPVIAVHGWVKRPESRDETIYRKLVVQTGMQAMRGRT